jgi:hypothetical protein
VPTSSLFPSDGLQSFAPVELSYRRLHKAALILTGLGVTDAHLEWLTGEPAHLDLDGLPMEPGGDGVALFRKWRQLAALYALRRKLPRSNVDLFEVFRAATLPEALERLVLATGWDRAVVESFLGPEGFAVDSVEKLRPPVEPTEEEPVILRLARAVRVQRRIGVAPATLYSWANSLPDTDGAAAIVQAVKARYDETRWLEVARTLNDPLRAERRDALVSYLLPRMHDLGVRNRNQLFEYFLIDVDMNPCMLTSRVQRAIAALQTFFQRCLMNLEPKVPPRFIDDNDWKWLKNYRVWEANRKVFLYPENWIEPELRDDKSPLFQVLERTILEQEIKNENVEAASRTTWRGSTRSRGSTCAASTSRSASCTGWSAARSRPSSSSGRFPVRTGTTARTTSLRAPSTRPTSGSTAGSRTAASGPRGRRSRSTSKGTTSFLSFSSGGCTCSGPRSAR